MISTVGYRNKGDLTVPSEIINEITSVISSVDLELGNYKSTRLKEIILGKLRDNNWSGEMRLDEISKISITAAKDDIGLCLQIGNVARTYADLLKLQTLFSNDRISGGIIIVPVDKASKRLGVNVASLERLLRELDIFSSTITIPLVVVGFND